MHKRIMQWQADNATITWIFSILIWALVFGPAPSAAASEQGVRPAVRDGP